ncbi:MAG TPA: PstS family phosphate ABC transporter substrate-binding protein [Gemmataceae bacterium]|nr:PstS family phosphate ABC transporter substrate-binding protein [Gemmataceae bacterium]
MKSVLRFLTMVGFTVALCLGTAGCNPSKGDKEKKTTDEKESATKGEIKIDGSSTVYLITEAVSAQFKKLHPKVNISIGISGTGGGLRKFIANELDICDASRKIKGSEAEQCKKKGIEFLELQVAWDGLAVVINKKNDFAKKLTMEQLKKIWHPDTDTFKNAKSWKDVDPSFPDQPFNASTLWGAGKDSGTFDYFTEAVNGKERLIRQDYNGHEDDNVIVTGVSKNDGAMGFFGVAYYTANKSTLNVVAIAKKAGDPYYEPTEENVLSGKYPISRPLFIYVKKDSLKRPEVKEFVDFYQRRTDLVKTAGYVEMNTLQQSEERKKFQEAVK